MYRRDLRERHTVAPRRTGADGLHADRRVVLQRKHARRPPASSASLATDCPGTDTACHRRICGNQNTCGFANELAGTSAGADATGNCRKAVCDDIGGITSAPDDTDVPADDGNACTDDVCSSGAPSHPAKSDGTACTGASGGKGVQRRRLRAVPRQDGLRRDGHALPPVRLPGRPHLWPHRRPGRNGGGHRRDRQLPQVGLRRRGRRHVRRRRHGHAGRRQFVHRRRLHERHPDEPEPPGRDAVHDDRLGARRFQGLRRQRRAATRSRSASCASEPAAPPLSDGSTQVFVEERRLDGSLVGTVSAADRHERRAEAADDFGLWRRRKAACRCRATGITSRWRATRPDPG